MDEFPFKVTIAIPTFVPTLSGRDSTALPYGYITTIRVARTEMETIERAIKVTGFDISRGGFIRIAALRTAEAILKHNAEYRRRLQEGRDAGPKLSRAAQPAQAG